MAYVMSVSGRLESWTCARTWVYLARAFGYVKRVLLAKIPTTLKCAVSLRKEVRKWGRNRVLGGGVVQRDSACRKQSASL